MKEDRSRVEIFREHSTRKRESVWGPFLNLLNRQDGFIMNMTSSIIAKLACWSHELMEKTDLQFYLTWLKDQLKLSVSFIITIKKITIFDFLCTQCFLFQLYHRFQFNSIQFIICFRIFINLKYMFRIIYMYIVLFIFAFYVYAFLLNPNHKQISNKRHIIFINNHQLGI